MRITPLDIEQQQFGRSFRGYNEDEVDNFLDRIAKDYEEILNENIKTKEELERLQTRIEEYSRMEDVLRNALVSAQQSASNIKENVQIEAQAVIENARIEAEKIKQRARQEILDISNEIASLKKNKQLIFEKLKNTLKLHINMLEEEILEEPGIEIEADNTKINTPFLENIDRELFLEKDQFDEDYQNKKNTD